MKMIKLPDWSEDIKWALSSRKHALGLYASSVIFVIIVTVIWTVVGHYIGSGWVLGIVNIVGFLIIVALLLPAPP